MRVGGRRTRLAQRRLRAGGVRAPGANRANCHGCCTHFAVHLHIFFTLAASSLSRQEPAEEWRLISTQQAVRWRQVRGVARRKRDAGTARRGGWRTRTRPLGRGAPRPCGRGGRAMAAPRVVDRREAARSRPAAAPPAGPRGGPSDIARVPPREMPTSAQRVVANPGRCSHAGDGRRCHGLVGASSTEAAGLPIQRRPSARRSALLSLEVQVPTPTNVGTRAGLARDPRVSPRSRSGRRSRNSVGPPCCRKGQAHGGSEGATGLSGPAGVEPVRGGDA